MTAVKSGNASHGPNRKAVLDSLRNIKAECVALRAMPPSPARAARRKQLERAKRRHGRLIRRLETGLASGGP